MKGYLVLSTGDVFEGELFGHPAEGEGELVFNTGMTGYQEVMTDPSYAGQIVTFTYPLIGNYGVNDLDSESLKPALKGIVVAELCEKPSHYMSSNALAAMAEKYTIPGIYGVDTRAITQIIREQGEVYGKITVDPGAAKHFQGTPVIGQVSGVTCQSPKTYRPYTGGQPDINGQSIVGLPYTAGQPDIDGQPHTNDRPHTVGRQQHPHVVLIDFGYKKSILDALLKLGCQVTVVPYHISFDEIQQLKPDGILLSNGPGDPKELIPFLPQLRRIVESCPTLGICLGHQLIALMYGCDTDRLPYGHRGSNHPVKELFTGKVYITSQNHGYVVKEESVNKSVVKVTYRNVNDKSVEGLQHRLLPVSTVQFHPEAHPGPSDTEHIFRHFIAQCQCQLTGEKSYA